MRIDPSVTVPLWGLSDVGSACVEATKTALPLHQTQRIVSSLETKAIETAAILADHWDIPIVVHELAHENDRSSTGFLPPPESEKMADAFLQNRRGAFVAGNEPLMHRHALLRLPRTP